MATDDELLLVRIEAQITKFEKAMAKATVGASTTAGKIERRFRDMERNLSSVGAGFTRDLVAPIAALATVAGLERLASSVRETVKSAAQLVDLADKIGITTDRLQELRFQADQNGSSAEALDSALEQFSKRVGLAAAGSGDLLKILNANGIALRDNEGKMRPLIELLAAYAELIKNATSDQDRGVLSLEAFGKGGDEAANIFRGGAADIERWANKAHELNQVVGEEGVRALESFDDRLSELSGRWNTFWTEATVVALNALEKIGQAEHFLLDPVIDALSHVADQNVDDLKAQIADLEARVGQFKDIGAGGLLPDVQLDIRRLDVLKAKLAELTQATPAAAAGIVEPRTKDDRVLPSGPTVIPRLGGGSGVSDAERQKKAVANLIAELQRELTLVGATDTQRRISNELRRAGAAATQEQKDQITALVANIAAEEEAQKQLIDTLDGVRNAAGSALDAFAQSIQNGEGAAAGLKAALVDVLQTIIRIGEQQAIMSLFGAAGTGGGGLLGGILGGLFGASRATPSVPALSRGGGAPAVVQLVVGEGQAFEPRVRAISGAVVVQHTSGLESRAIARGPAVARDNQRRFGTP